MVISIPRTPRISWVVAFCFLLALLTYSLSFTHSVGWGDSADLSLRSADLSFNDFRGGSRDYFLYRHLNAALIAALGQWFEPAILVNCLNAILGAFGVAITAGLAGVITASPWAALGAGVALTFSHTYWFLSSTAEVYIFNIVLSYGSLLFLLLWIKSSRLNYLLIGSIMAGLSLSHHASGLLLVGVFLGTAAVIQLRKRELKIDLLYSFLVVVTFAAIYFIRIFAAFDLQKGLVRSAQLDVSVNPNYDANPLREAFKFLLQLGLNFPVIASILIVLGVWYALNRRLYLLIPILCWGVPFFLAGITSQLPTRFEIYIIGYPAIAVLAGLGLASVIAWCRKHARGRSGFHNFIGFAVVFSLASIPPIIYWSTAAYASRKGVNLTGARLAPYRDNNWYFIWPPKVGDVGPITYASDAFKYLHPGDILISDYTLWRVLLYSQRVRKQGAGINLVFVERLLSPGILSYINSNYDMSRRIFLATNVPASYYQLDQLDPYYRLEPKGSIYQVIRKSNP
jgi:hypothetical protein